MDEQCELKLQHCLPGSEIIVLVRVENSMPTLALMTYIARDY